MSDRSSGSSRLLSVDILRALAAMWVVVHHVPFLADDVPRELWFWLSVPLRFGYCGVTLFLVLSGFCIHLTVARRMAQGEGVRAEWGRFWKRRIWRLYPPYVAAIMVSLIVTYLVGTPAYLEEYHPPPLAWDLLAHLLMIHNLLADCWLGLGNMAFWSLGLEEQLYGLYAVYLALRRRLPAPPVLAMTGVVSIAWVIGVRWLGGPQDWGANRPSLTIGELQFGQWMMWPFTWWFAWTLGAVAAEAYSGAIRLPRWCFSYRIVIAFALPAIAMNRIILNHVSVLYSGTFDRIASAVGVASMDRYLVVLCGFSDFLVAAATFVLLNRWIRDEGAGAFRSRLPRTLGAIGLMSYSLYLIHMPVLHVVEGLATFGSGVFATLLRFLVMVPCCLAASACFYLAVERHFLNTKAKTRTPMAASLEPRDTSAPPTVPAEAAP